MTRIKMLLVAFVAALTLSGAVVATEVVNDQAPAAEASITDCFRFTSAPTSFYGQCNRLTPYAPYYTRHVIVADCVRAWYLGGGSYTAVGDWMQVGQLSHGWCQSLYVPKNLRHWFK